jgi:LPS sulfotransferase NodH
MTPFVLVSTHRSGSSVLRYALDAHPRVVARAELLRPGATSRHALDAFLRASRARRWLYRAAPGVVLDRFLDDVFGPRPGIEAAGFKLLYDQATPAVWRRLERRSGLRIVHLVRENLLKALVSLAAATSRRQFRLRPDEPWRFERVRLDPVGLLPALRTRATEIERHRARLAGRPHLEVRYEDLLADPRPLVAEVLRFLGVEGAVPDELPLVKMTPDALADAVANLGEVAAALRGSEFEAFLDAEARPAHAGSSSG